MHLIVDSGSTKSDWVLLNESTRESFRTIGLNPNFHTEESVFAAICENDELLSYRDVVTHVFFYGSGCASEKLNRLIHDGLAKAFHRAKIIVDHDLMGCALATYQSEPAISCILGTGSNSCFFDGEHLTQEVPSLGYVLGDEGSGTYFGKKLITNFFYNRLPKELHDAIQNELKLTKEEVISRVYKEANPNVYLASFMPFIFDHSKDVFIQEMMYKGFKDFLEVHVCGYQDYTQYKVHFIGSIAALFREELKSACDVYTIQIGQVIRKPIDGLISYHSVKLN